VSSGENVGRELENFFILKVEASLKVVEAFTERKM
jgi:hypothetical protein